MGHSANAKHNTRPRQAGSPAAARHERRARPRRARSYLDSDFWAGGTAPARAPARLPMLAPVACPTPPANQPAQSLRHQVGPPSATVTLLQLPPPPLRQTSFPCQTLRMHAVSRRGGTVPRLLQRKDGPSRSSPNPLSTVRRCTSARTYITSVGTTPHDGGV